MFKLAALNDKDIEDKSRDTDGKTKGTKEAQEVHAFDLYNKALQLQRDNQHDLAFRVYEQLLKTSLVTDAASTLVDENGEATERPLKDPGLILKYSTHKNLASISADKGDIDTAMEHYLQAVMLDTTDVTLWQRIGTHAISLGKLALARHAFTSGLTCNENYWPCLDAAVTVLFALLDYESCLYWISKAFERNPAYAKGLVLREKMFRDCPHLRKDTQNLFRNCDFSIYEMDVDEEEVKEYIDEAMLLRERHRKSCVSVPPGDVAIRPEMLNLTWANLGKCLVSTYEYISTTDDNATFTSKCVFTNIQFLEDQLEQKKQAIKEKEANENKQDDETTKPKSPYIPGEVSEDSVDSMLGLDLAMEVQKTSPARMSVSFDLAVPDNFCSSQDSTQQSMDIGNAVFTEVNQLLVELVDEVAKQDDQVAVESNDEDVVEEIMKEMISMVVQGYKLMFDDKGGVVEDVLQQLISDVVKNVNGAEIVSESATDTNTSQEMSFKGKRATKRKRNLTDALDEHSKRRSTRVRVSTKKKQQQVLKILAPPPPKTDYRSKLIKLLPASLLNRSPNNTSTSTKQDESKNKERSVHPRSRDPNPSKYDVITEANDVLEFVKNNNGEAIVDLLHRFDLVLSEKASWQWAKGTKEMLVSVFACTQKHLQFMELDEVDSEDNMRRCRDDLYSILNCVECQIDCNEKKVKTSHELTAEELDGHIHYLESALLHKRIFRTTSSHSLDSLPLQDIRHFAMRFLWARSKLTGPFRPSDEAIRDLNVCKDLLVKASRPHIPEPFGTSDHGPFYLHLPNLHNGPIISMKTVKNRLEVFERKQVLDNVKRLFESESYSEVIELLCSTLNDTPQISTNPDRPRQIRQLLISHEKMLDNVGVARSASYVVAEIVTNAEKASELKDNRDDEVVESQTNKRSLKEWTSTLHVVVQITARALDNEASSFDQLTTDDRSRLCNGIASAIGFVFTELDEGRSFLAKNTAANLATLQWIILYKLVKYEERHIDFPTEVTEIPSSFCVLNTAHQWTGERGMCIVNNGQLLRFTIQEYNTRVKRIKQHLLPSVRDSISRMVEQCFCCLFAYPSRGKVRYLQEHSVKQLTATWPDYLAMFSFSRPPRLPEFDSFKAITVSFDFTQLILRAINFVPQSVQSQIPNSDSDVTAFVESHRDDVTAGLKTLEGGKDEVRALGDMYYLLGDYNFKNKDMTKAVKYYSLDLRINPTRFDSWAGMALARSSQTDDRLRLCESKKSQHKLSDSGTEKKGLVALSCFKRALNFESTSAKLLIEHGSLAYWMHSMYSRQIKRKSSQLSEEDIKTINNKKDEMLKIARKSFEVVRECDTEEIYGEEWFIDYMTGKLCEKERKPIRVYLRYFQSAAEILHRRHAKYPKRIQPKYGAVNDMAIEALEMHFRVHCSILKYLMSRVKNNSGQKVEYDVTSDEVAFMKDLVDQMSKSPFVLREERKSTTQFAVAADVNKPPKLAAVSESSDLTMGSLLPDSVLQALHIEVEEKTDEDTQPSVLSTDGDTQGTVTSERRDSSSRQEMAGSSDDAQANVLKGQDGSFDPARRPSVDDHVRHEKDCDAIITACESALRLCLRRFPQHNKSAYRLAQLYCTNSSKKHLDWSRDLLFGSPSPWQQKWHMPAPGLLSDRNKTNLFNGVWRIPMDDIDRPGSFSAHLRRCVALLTDVMREMGDHQSLLHLHNMLNRSPDHGRKYLRDDDRIQLARQALVYCRSVLHRKVSELKLSVSPNRNTRKSDLGVEPKLGPSFATVGKYIQTGQPSMPFSSMTTTANPDKSHRMDNSDITDSCQTSSAVEESLNLVMDAYKVFQDTQRHPDSTTKVDTSVDEHDVTQQRLLADAYHKYTCCVAVHSSNDDTATVALQEKLPDSLVVPTFEQAVRFCQHRAFVRKQASSTNSKSHVTSTTPSQTSIKSPKDHTQPPSDTARLTHDDAMRSDSGGATAAANHVKGLSLVDAAMGNADSTENSKEGSGSNPTPAEPGKPSGDHTSKVTMVEKEGKKYTRIGPPLSKPGLGNHSFMPSSGSAFTATSRLGGDEGSKQKRLRVDPGLKHLMLPTTSDVNGSSNKRLVRSTSVPVTQTHLDEQDADAENKPPYVHRAIYRTGSSVSDYTLDRLKKSILARTSAALVRKPSITEQEMMQIGNDVDYDSSSQSEDEDDATNDETSRSNKRKYCDDGPNPVNPDSFTEVPVTSPLAAMQSTVITTAGST
uniref:Uncharacterized protein LOC100182772 n=1 Tax=Phallusia mammillata TaxID=59560 RepID=A0A6F9DH11_9ASCI|nr:uncharacterized protein LOC100182772 [Phallusia mammillata]